MSHDETILDAAIPFLNTCVSLGAVAASIVECYGHHILTELLLRIKDARNPECLAGIAVTLQKIFMRDIEGVSNVVLGILTQVRKLAAAPLFKHHLVCCHHMRARVHFIVTL